MTDPWVKEDGRRRGNLKTAAVAEGGALHTGALGTMHPDRGLAQRKTHTAFQPHRDGEGG